MNEDVVFIDKKWRSPSSRAESPPKGAIKMSDYFTPERSASAGDAVSCGVCFVDFVVLLIGAGAEVQI